MGRREIGESVVVIGGGLVGCETALYLAQKGKKLTILEILDDVAQDMVMANRMHLLKLLADTNVNILTKTSIVEMMDDSVVIVNKYGRSKLENDTVVLAVGSKPNKKLKETLKDKVPEIYVIGDCVEPRKVLNAIWEGFRFARLI